MARLTITLSSRRPVMIEEDAWPVVAEAEAKASDNQYEFQANRTWKWGIVVRQHADGRALVYAYYDSSSQYAGERNKEVRHGQLLKAGEDLPTAISSVGADMGEESDADLPDGWTWHQVTADCIASLTPEQLD